VVLTLLVVALVEEPLAFIATIVYVCDPGFTPGSSAS